MESDLLPPAIDAADGGAGQAADQLIVVAAQNRHGVGHGDSSGAKMLACQAGEIVVCAEHPQWLGALHDQVNNVRAMVRRRGRHAVEPGGVGTWMCPCPIFVTDPSVGFSGQL